MTEVKVYNENKAERRRRLRRKGFGLLETLLAGVIGAVIIYEGIQQFGGNQLQNNIQTDQNQVNFLAANVKEYYKGYGTFKQTGGYGATQAITLSNQNAVKAHWYQPDSVVDPTGGVAPKNPWGGAYDIEPSDDGTYFMIAQDHVPSQACTLLTSVNNDAGGGGILGTSITTAPSTAQTSITATGITPGTYANPTLCLSTTSGGGAYYQIGFAYGM